MNMVILSPDNVFTVSREVFEREALRQFGPGIKEDDTPEADVTLRYERDGEPMFHIVHSRKGWTISTDGTPEQAAEVAVWARSLVPEEPGGRIWMVDQGYTGHVELTAGIRPEDVQAGWIDHSDESAE